VKTWAICVRRAAGVVLVDLAVFVLVAMFLITLRP
jgi:hypothetical protein